MANANKKSMPVIVTDLHALLEPLDSDDRQKVVASVMMLFGESAPPSKTASQGNGAGGSPNTHSTLAKYIREHGADDKPGIRFLAVANWLHEKGQDRVSLADVNNAISDAKQKRLSNPSHFLKSNTTSGNVEGNKESFYVTNEGREQLGINE